MAKAASSLYMHNLTGVLETAIRATNAQYDDPEIIERLDCRLLEVRGISVKMRKKVKRKPKHNNNNNNNNK